MGLLPYRQRLQRLRLTTLLECRMRSDLIKTCKIINGFVDYIVTICLGRIQLIELVILMSLLIIHSRSAYDFFSNRVIKYWNQLPLRVRNSTSINAFKAGLNLFKLSKPDSPNGLWKVSQEVFNRISDKNEHVNYLLANRYVAMWQNFFF